MSAEPSAAERALPGMWATAVTYEGLRGDPKERITEAVLRGDAEVAAACEALRERLLAALLPGSRDDEEGLALAQTGVMQLAQGMHVDGIDATQFRVIEDLIGDVTLHVADQFLETLDDDALFDALEEASDADESCDGDVVAYLAAAIRADIEAKVKVSAAKKRRPTTLKKKKHPRLPGKDA